MPPHRVFCRSKTQRMLGGVIGGIAERTGIDPTLLRIISVPLTLLAGVGAIVYMAAWILLPLGDEQSIASAEIADHKELRNALGVGTVALAVALGLQALGLHSLGVFSWPFLLCVVGLFIVWRGCSNDERIFLQEALENLPFVGVGIPKTRRIIFIRCIGGLIFIGLGLAGLASVTHSSGAAARGFFGAIALFAGFFITLGPWWLRMLKDLTAERRERVRAEERAEMAAHLHDSVLQTLALIQKSAGDASETIRLARAQERELRTWLFGGKPGTSGDGATLAVALANIEGEVEDERSIGVETVIVGDCTVDERLSALLAAGREAIVNAAKWSGDTNISVFAEVRADAVSMFVRDRGRGFDPETVNVDCHGISQSIIDRMSRHGGRATIRSEIGAGTEIELEMPRRIGTK